MRLNVYFRSLNTWEKRPIMMNDNSTDPNGQFNKDENPVENTENNTSETASDNNTDANEEAETKSPDVEATAQPKEEVPVEKETAEDKGDNVEDTTKPSDSEPKTESTPPSEEDAPTQKEEKVEKTEEPGNNVSDEKEEVIEEKVDFTTLNKAELVAALEKIILEKSIEQIGNEPDQIKVLFYKLHKTEVENLKQNFLSEGGKIEDFMPQPDVDEIKLKELINNYRHKKSEYNRQLEEEKNVNLEKKHQVIENIKDLVNRKESINKTFHDFRELQQLWRDIGLVPQQNVKSLWESYHLACEMFYDYININKELRDLDLKKNLEAKTILCERAEKLLIEPSVVSAFKSLQALHERWREIGPVPSDKKTEIWERFKEITSKINKKHHQYFEKLKENQKQNLAEKNALCEKVEEINQITLSNAKEWEAKSKDIIEIQKVWKTIGFTPKKDNNAIYARFREACDIFFNRKREFFSGNKEEQKNNLQLKTDLCVQAETLKESTDWKNTTDQLIGLQKKWKDIGPVPRKYSDQIWERFRSACDIFFNRKSEFFSNIEGSYEDNLKMKLELIEKIEHYKLLENTDKNFENINAFQKEWADIGFVPLKQKEEVQSRFRNAVNVIFDQLNIDEEEKSAMKFDSKLHDILSKPNGAKKISQERDKLVKKLSALESDIVVWENNIGFFANTKNADSLIKDVNSKITNGKRSIDLLKIKLKSLDDFCDENNIR